jgi:hypothetical protein
MKAKVACLTDGGEKHKLLTCVISYTNEAQKKGRKIYKHHNRK